MSKQIKIGFNQVPAPTSQVFEPLYDINTGIILRNAQNQILYTTEPSALGNFLKSDRSLSVHANNETDSALVIQEQFAETSQVSSSLLGVPRSEIQLSLFSDVSTYGLDDNTWEFFRSPVPFQPVEWATRNNPTYGPRFNQRLEEVPEEQAIALTGFPAPWTFPFGPNFNDVGLFNSALYERYKRFINLGNLLYDSFDSAGFTNFAEKTFLSSNYVLIVNDEIVYNSNFSIEEIFSKIESWTLSWMKLRDGQLIDPNGLRLRFPTTFDASNTSPGYFSQRNYYCQLESKKTFRYQPGRISGFTFGVRASTDPGSVQNIIEWGCANETDEYMFQLKGSQFNIIRRSIIPLPETNLKNMNLTENDQQFKPVLNPWRNSDLGQGTQFNYPELWETVIPRNKFNGDGLDGNGLSGYVISFEEVTMYKIEFSWYGAIGAKFYAYVPASNDQARWVLIHTIIIENELGKPCLNDPFFKFRYVLSMSDTSNLTFPQYIYKYGASYYIDGGDEGTVTNHSYSSNIIDINNFNSRSVFGILPKDVILNQDGISIKNRKDIIPTKMTISSSTSARVDIVECEGCPGHSHHYAPSLLNGTSGVVGSLTISEDGTTATFEPSNSTQVNFVPENPDQYSKVIGSGLYDLYLYKLSDETLGIARRSANSRTNNNINKQSTYINTDLVRLANGQTVPVKGRTFENVRLTQYSNFIASTVRLTKKNIRINFLNPRATDSSTHFADFMLGITDQVPTVDVVSNELLFGGLPVDLEKLLFVEFSHWFADKDVNGNDRRESDPRVGNVFEMDPRLRVPSGVDSGRCSSCNITVTESEFLVEYQNSNPESGESGNFLIFNSSEILNFDSLLGGELGIVSTSTGKLEGSGIFYTDDKPTAYADPVTNQIRYYISITEPAQNIQIVYTRLCTMEGRYVRRSKVFKWNLYPLYIVVGMRDRARINNITIEEFDEISKFSYTPTWIKSASSSITVINSGIANERFDPVTGLFNSGGFSNPGDLSSNYRSVNRLDSTQIDNQLQQPLRPGEVKSTFFVGKDETNEIDLTHVFGYDRLVLTPGLLNAKATFVISKSLDSPGQIQINLNVKEQ
jgi:hypothetical protein